MRFEFFYDLSIGSLARKKERATTPLKFNTSKVPVILYIYMSVFWDLDSQCIKKVIFKRA